MNIVNEEMRLQKFLSRAGVASRRASEELIEAGRVRVDGRTVREQGVKVDPDESVVEVDGRRVEASVLRWVMLHKPPGYVCTRQDPRGRRTVYDLLPERFRDLFHVGRLDYMSEGLQLLTNQGDVANALLHPSGGTMRGYELLLAEPVPPHLVATLLAGVELEDGPASATAARLEAPAPQGRGRPRSGERRLLIELREGRNREIRRMMNAVDARIHVLKRVAFGPVHLGDLPPGAWRELRGQEVEALGREAAGSGDAGRGRAADGGAKGE